MIDFPKAPNPAWLYTVCIFMRIFATTVVILRFWVRKMKTAGFGADGWTILAGLVSFSSKVNLFWKTSSNTGHLDSILDNEWLCHS